MRPAIHCNGDAPALAHNEVDHRDAHAGRDDRHRHLQQPVNTTVRSRTARDRTYPFPTAGVDDKAACGSPREGGGRIVEEGGQEGRPPGVTHTQDPVRHCPEIRTQIKEIENKSL